MATLILPVVLILVIPDFRVLASVGYPPIVLALVVTGDESVALFGNVCNPTSLLLLSGFVAGLCFTVLAVRSWPPQKRLRISGSRLRTLGLVATYTAAAIPVFYATTRICWALGIPFGISREFLDSLESIAFIGLGLALLRSSVPYSPSAWFSAGASSSRAGSQVCAANRCPSGWPLTRHSSSVRSSVRRVASLSGWSSRARCRWRLRAQSMSPPRGCPRCCGRSGASRSPLPRLFTANAVCAPSTEERAGEVSAALAVLHGAVAFRRSLPEVAFVAGSLAMLVLTFSPSISNEGVTVSAVFVPSSLMYLVLLYSVAAACERLPAMVALVAALVGSLIVMTRTFWSSDERSVFQSTSSGIPVIVATVFIADGGAAARTGSR